MIMEFILNEQKAQALGYPVQACYDVIDKLFAAHGVLPEKRGFYCGPTNQAMYNACSEAGALLIKSSWFLKVADHCYWYVASDNPEDREDYLAAYYRVQAMHKE